MNLFAKDGIQRGFVAACFLAFLGAGLAVSGDFGVHLDEYNNQGFGELWGGYVARAATSGRLLVVGRNPTGVGERGALPDFNFCHGPFWEMSLHAARKIFSAEDPRDVLLLRHRSNFLLFFCASFLFYLTCARMFKDRALGLLGWLMLVLHPRILADSFYNTVDLAFLSFFIAGGYTLFRLLEKQNVPSALCHALACAGLAATRAAGLILPALTLGLLALEGFRAEDGDRRRRLWRAGGAFAGAFLPALILFWPLLWRNTLMNFIDSIRDGMFRNVQGFEGEFAQGPLYNAWWIGLTTPPVFLFFFVCGALAVVLPFFRNSKRSSVPTREPLIALVLWLIPIAIASLAGTSLFNGWRHHYFTYPFFVIVGLFGFERLLKWAGHLRDPKGRGFLVFSIRALLFAGFFTTIRFIAGNHPFEYSYANVFAGLKGRELQAAVMKDYWAVSQRQALEFVLARDARRPLRISSSYFNGYLNIFPKGTRDAIRWVPPGEPADYRIGLYSERPENGQPNDKLFHLIEVDGIPIAAVYR